MRSAIIDTDILSEIHRNVNESVRTHYSIYLAIHGRISISAITVHERFAGHAKEQKPGSMRRFLEELQLYEVLTFDADAARISGEIEGSLRARGRPVGPVGALDSLIAATAIRHDRAIVTGNTRHFRFIAEVAEPLGHTLEIRDWRSPSV
jgi:tRNA(fMet)-specific endonuclease VapC